MLINSPNISGSLTVTGNATISGSLTVAGGINATITGSATTASYVEYNNIANKPTLVSGSEQVSFNGITDKPTLVSGSEQITYSGLSGIPSGIVSSSTQITGYNVFATTGSNQFDGSQAITGSLTVTGQVVAQTLNVQQVTSSIVFSSGSNIFGNSLSNTQQFTGSLQVTGSTHYLLGNMGIGTTSPDVFSRGDERNVGISVPGASDNLALALNAGGSAGRGAQIYMGQGGTRHFTVSSNATETRVGTATSTPLILTTNDTTRLTIASTGAATFSSTAQDSFTINTTNTDGPVIRIQNSGTNVGLFGNAEGVTNGGTTNFAIRATNNLIFSTGGANPRMTILSGGNVGINQTNPSGRLEVVPPNASGNEGIFVNQLGSHQSTIRFKSAHSADSDYRIGASILTGNAFEIFSVNANASRLTISSTGAATFSSTITSTGAISSGGGTFSSYYLAPGNVSSGGTTAFTYNQLAGEFTVGFEYSIMSLYAPSGVNLFGVSHGFAYFMADGSTNANYISQLANNGWTPSLSSTNAGVFTITFTAGGAATHSNINIRIRKINRTGAG